LPAPLCFLAKARKGVTQAQVFFEKQSREIGIVVCGQRAVIFNFFLGGLLCVEN
jgi:hypothetical protein